MGRKTVAWTDQAKANLRAIEKDHDHTEANPL